MFSLLLGIAHAQSAPAPAPDAPAQEVTEAPLYLMTRGAIAVPFSGSGDLPSAGLGMGLDIGDGQSIGLRAVYMHDVPPGTRAGADPPPWAWGPMVDFNMRFQPQARRSAFLHLSAGFVYGTPEGQENIVVPLGEVGVGLEFDHKVDEKRTLFLAPELGVIPTFFNVDGGLINLEAPYAAFSIGMRVK